MLAVVTAATSRAWRMETTPANAALAASKLSYSMAKSMVEWQAAINESSSNGARWPRKAHIG